MHQPNIKRIDSGSDKNTFGFLQESLCFYVLRVIREVFPAIFFRAKAHPVGALI